MAVVLTSTWVSGCSGGGIRLESLVGTSSGTVDSPSSRLPLSINKDNLRRGLRLPLLEARIIYGSSDRLLYSTAATLVQEPNHMFFLSCHIFSFLG